MATPSPLALQIAEAVLKLHAAPFFVAKDATTRNRVTNLAAQMVEPLLAGERRKAIEGEAGQNAS